MSLVNKTGISLSLAVWLATDDYEHNPDPNYISATGLLKPIRQTILGRRVTTTNIDYDIYTNIPTCLGSSVHAGIEQAWKTNYKEALILLGYPTKMVDRVLINPKPEEVTSDSIPVYIEQRAFKKIMGFTVGGMYDFIGDGALEDFKSMGVYSYMIGGNDDNYIKQGSIYRWLNPEIVTKDYMLIQCIFTDWSKLHAMIQKKKGYPQSRLITKKLQLLSLQETENFIKEKISNIIKYKDTAEEELPECTSEDLWRSKPTYKYYKNPNNTKRSTANFDEYHLAHTRLLEDGNTGIIKEIKGQVKRCNYCNGFTMCTQKDKYIVDGSLIV